MKSIFLVVAIICSTNAQNGRLLQAPTYNNGHGWDIRLAVPGQPGNDYPTLATIPRTSFSCAGREPGYYADTETNCQVFRVCTVGATYGFQSFLCPNGTLFNQAVFVCDWWMNVNCKNSNEVLTNKNEQFENLKLGPHLLKDIKKMLTHPVRNPFNTNAMRSKLLVMQSYKPPSGQLFPNGALLAPPERTPSHIYIPTKAIQIALRQNGQPSESFAASTSNPEYLLPTFSTFTPTTVRNVEILQRQVLNVQNIKSQNNSNLQTEQTISNGHAGQVPVQTRHSQSLSSLKNDQTNRQLQKYSNFRNTQRAQTNNEFNSLDTKNNYNTLQAGRIVENNDKQLRNKDKKNKINYNIDPSYQVKQQHTFEAPRPSSTISNTQTSEKIKQSLVSSDIIPPTILTKTLTYSRLVQEPKQGQLKPRITFKTWVLKPTKNAKLTINPTPYIYSEPSDSLREESEFEEPYNYNKPSVSVSLENAPEAETEGYNYDKPTEPSVVSSPTEEEVSPLYLSPTTLRPSFNEPLLTTTTSEPIEESRQYLAPESRNPSARQYLPPSESTSIQSNQYLTPKASLRKLSRYQNGQSLASYTSTKTDYATSSRIRDINTQNNSEHSNNNVNNNNLSFSEFLSKEKLDITINEIVNETDEIAESPEELDSKVSKSLPSEYNTGNTEELTERSGSRSKPIKIVAVPSTKLEPPTETFNNYQNSNKYANLPFFKQTVLPTIERTVSIKITIPESIANFLFDSPEGTELEILNTDNSNYLVLRNTQNDSTSSKFTPIGKLTWNENFNHSASQALVFSLLTDSINKAKKYNKVIQDNVQSLTPSPPSKFQSANNEVLGRISKTISRLTASQFTNNNLEANNINSANIASILKTKSPYVLNRYQDADTQIFHENISSPKYMQQKTAQLTQNYKLYSKQNNNQLNGSTPISQVNTNKPIYSGQLYKYPVPEVTRQIINAPNPANSNILIQSDLDDIKSQRIVIPKNSITKSLDSSSNISTKIFKSQGLRNSPIKIEVTSTTEKSQLTNLNDETQKYRNIFVNNILRSGSGITAQLQDKIMGTIPLPTHENKFVSYKKDQSYNLYSKLDDINLFSNRQTAKQNIKQIQNNNYPDLITFHFIPSENQNEENFPNEPQSYQLTELKPVNNNARIELSDNSINDHTYNTNVAYSMIHRTSQKESEPINTLYDGPSSYSAPQSSIGNLLSTQKSQNSNFNSRIEDLDETNNFNGYLKEQPTREFPFK